MVETPSVFHFSRWRQRGRKRARPLKGAQQKQALVHPLPWLASLYPAMLVIKVVCRWPLLPLSQRHLHLDNCASRMVARPKRKRMKKSSKIDSINIRRHHLGVTGIVYSEGYAYAVRYAPNTRVTEELIRKSWRESRLSFRPYNDSTDMFL
jgi:hypothetical protein